MRRQQGDGYIELRSKRCPVTSRDGIHPCTARDCRGYRTRLRFFSEHTLSVGLRPQDPEPATHCRASSMAERSKKRTSALVKGLQKTAMACCHFVSPTRASRSMSWK